MSETTTLLKVGSAELVLRLIEAGVPMRDFTLENPIRAIRDMSRDRSGHVKVALSNGRRISALELQTEYYEKVSEFVRRFCLPRHSAKSLDAPFKWREDELQAAKAEQHTG